MSTWPEWLPIREDLKALSPYGAPQIEKVIALNTNENPYPLPQQVVEQITTAISKIAPNLNRYPDRDAIELRTQLAHYINKLNKTNFDFLNVWAANGSNEILQTLMLTCGSRGALGFSPSYSMHPLIAKVCGVNWISGNRNTDFTLDLDSALDEISKSNPSLVFITSPNNPTGNAIDILALEKLALASQKVGALLVVDEAYEEFSSVNSAVTLLSKFKNIVVVRTMSKAFALAGARCGYLIGDQKIVEMALIARLPYHLSSQTQAIALAALANFEVLQAEVSLLKNERNRVSSELAKFGFSVIDSDANFLLFKGFKAEAKDIWQALLDDGILIRDVGLTEIGRAHV